MTDGDAYHAQFWGSPAEDFCRRRWLGAEVVSGWRLGFVETPSSKSHERFRGCLSIPYFDGRGREVALRYRPLYANPPGKYLSTRGDKPRLFGIRYVEYPRVYICEGEVDTMTLWQMGLKAVGVPGAQTWQPHWKWHFRNTDEVVVCYDPDRAGKMLAAKIFRDLEKVTSVSFVKGLTMDVNDSLREMGWKKLKGILEDA